MVTMLLKSLLCSLLCLFHHAYSEKTNDTVHLTKNFTTFFGDLQDISILQIRSSFSSDLELRVSPELGVLVYLEIDGTDRESMEQVGSVVEVLDDGAQKSLVLQIDQFVDEQHYLHIILPVGILTLCILICGACTYINRKQIRARHKLFMTSPTKRTRQGFGPKLEDKPVLFSQVLSLPDVNPDNTTITSGSTEKLDTVRSRARLFEKTAAATGGSATQLWDPNRDVEKNITTDTDESKPQIKYLIAKFQTTEDDVIDFTPKQHIVGIRYSTTPSDKPGEKVKVRKKFFMTSEARKRFISSPLKRLHQHVQAKIHDKLQTRSLKPNELKAAHRISKTYQKPDVYRLRQMNSAASSNQNSACKFSEFKRDPNAAIKHPKMKSKQVSFHSNVNHSDDTINERSPQHTTSVKNTHIFEDININSPNLPPAADGADTSPKEVQVSVVYLRNKMLRLLGNANNDSKVSSAPKSVNREITYAGTSTSTNAEVSCDVQSDSDDEENIPTNNEDMKELYELITALVEPSDENQGVTADDDVYGDVKIYDVRPDRHNNLRVSLQSSLLQEDQDSDEEESQNEQFMTVFDLHTPDGSDVETPCSPNEYEPVGCKRYSDTDMSSKRTSKRISQRSSQFGSQNNFSPTQDFMELYDLVSNLIEPADKQKSSVSGDLVGDLLGDVDTTDGKHMIQTEDDIYGTSHTREEKQGQSRTGQDIYVPQRRNIKYLISNFQMNEDNVKNFLPPRGHHSQQCVGETPPVEHTPLPKRGGAGKKGKKWLMSIFGILSLLTIVHAVTLLPPKVNKMVVYVHPSIFKAGAGQIEVFVPQTKHVTVNTDDWTPERPINVQIYDLDELPKLHEFCAASETCDNLNAYTMSKVSCDGRTDTCVCPRGYVLANDACVDLDECSTKKDNCHVYAYCENTIGSYTCTCNQTYGVWGDGKSCTRCSLDCPHEHYISVECTSHEDRICSECRQCSEEEYEFYGCGTRVNRHCLHPAGSPAILRDDVDDNMYTPVKNNTGYVVMHDYDTMYGENLHNITDLSWMYHMSAELPFRQKSKLTRQSGIQVEITLHTANLLPTFKEKPREYEDSTYDIAGLSWREKNVMNNFKWKYCSTLIPDYYTLSLRVYRDRMSAVRTVNCSQHHCPEGYITSSSYTYRTLNQHCPFSDPLPGIPTPNHAAICLNNLPLLNDVFDKRLEQTPVKRFPSDACHKSSIRCEECLHQNAESDCPVIYRDIRNQTDRERCCKISCYNTKDCRYALSDTCRKIPGDCSQGDVAELILASYVEDINTMNCHLGYVSPPELYSFSYRLTWSQFNIETQPMLVHVMPGTSGPANTKDTTQYEYLDVSHDTVLDLVDGELVLQGQKAPHHSAYAFTVHSLKQPSDFTGTSPRNHIQWDRRTNRQNMTFQTSAPFSINKLIQSMKQSSVIPDTADHNCPLDVGEVYERQTLYRPEGMDVDVDVHDEATGRLFNIIPWTKPTVIFNLTGNQSLMSQFFQNSGASLINDESLDADLDREKDKGIWEIKVKGYLTQCPGYIGFIVRDAHALLELIRYDLLVTCKHPPCDSDDTCKFKVKFEIPMADYGNERFFTMKILDFNSTYEIFLASVNKTRFPSLPQLDVPDYLFSLPDFPWTLFGSIIALGIAAAISLVSILIYAEKKNPKRHIKKFTKATEGKSGWVTGKNAELAKKVYVHSNKLQPRHCIFIIWVLIFKIAYACIFSFTAFYFILLMLHHDDLETIRSLPKFVKELNERNENLSRSIDQHRENEILRQQNHTGHMQQSCDIYLQNIFKKLRRKMAEITLFHRLQMFDIRATISFNVGELATKEMKEFAQRVGNFTRDYKQRMAAQLRGVYDPFAEWLHRVLYNGWFQIGVGLYQVRKHFVEPVFEALCIPLPAVNLLDFLGIDAALNINFMPRDLMQKIRDGLPETPKFDIPKLENMFKNFSLPGFLPEDLLHIYIPDIDLPGIDINICPAWANHNEEEETEIKRSNVDSQRSFVTPFDPLATQAEEDVLDEYFREMQQNRDENTSTDAKSLLHSLNKNEMFNIETADSEQEFHERQKDIAAETKVVYTSRVWDYTKNTLFKMFGILDIVLLLYRASKIYIVIAQLARGFTEIIPQEETERRIRENKLAAYEFEEKRKKVLYGGDYEDPRKNRISQAEFEIYISTNSKAGIFDRHRLEEDMDHPIKERLLCVGFFCFDALSTAYLAFINGTKRLIDKAIHTTIVPKLIFIGCASVVIYLIIIVGFLYMTVQALDELGIYDMLAARLDLNLEYSNLKIWENANFLENITMKAYYEQMQQQLSNMADVINSFNVEQLGIISLYEHEICSYRREITDNKQCDFKILFRRLEMELLPCQLISTTPEAYNGYERDVFINETKFDSEPYVNAIRDIIMHTFYALLVIIGLIIVIAALGYALFQYLKSRNMIRVIKVYQMDKEEQTYGAIYRTVKRRHTVRRRQRQVRREESQRGVQVLGNRRRKGDEDGVGKLQEIHDNGLMDSETTLLRTQKDEFTHG